MCESDNSPNLESGPIAGGAAPGAPLRQSEQLYLLLAENLTDVIWTMDLDLKVDYCSPSVLRLLGYTAEEAKGQSIEDMITPESAAVAREALREALEVDDESLMDHSDHRTLELEVIRKDGSTVWAETSLRLLRNAEKAPIGLVGVTRDVSERKKAEDELRKSEAKYRAIFESAGNGIAVIDLEGNFLDANRAYCEMLGYTREELLGGSVPDSVYPHHKKYFDAWLKEVKLHGNVRFESIRVAKDGSYIYIDVYGERFTYDGKPAYLGVISDVTERKRAENALRRSEEQYRGIFDAVADGICVLSPDGVLLDANMAMCGLLRWPRECLLGKSIRDVVDQRVAKDVDRFFDRIRHSGEFHDEVISELDDGMIATDVHARPYRYQDQPATLVVVRDVTERKRALEDLRKRTDRLQAQHSKLKAATEHKASFFASMSHELRTPMTSIIGFTELLLDDLEDPVTAGQRELLLKVSQNSRRLLGMVNDLLDLSRLESRRMTPVVSEVDLGWLMEQVVANMRPLAKDKELDLIVINGGSMSTAYTDEQKLSQILVNLVSNAIKFTPSGRITVAAEVTDSQVQLSVSDTGPGIPKSEHRKIFDEFHTMEQRGRQKVPGTGLGLAITKKLCKLLGGQIKVISEPGKGSTFVVVLPNSRP